MKYIRPDGVCGGHSDLPWQGVLGPDGSTSYTSTIAECVEAILREEVRRDPTVGGVYVTWGGPRGDRGGGDQTVIPMGKYNAACRLGTWVLDPFQNGDNHTHAPEFVGRQIARLADLHGDTLPGDSLETF